MFEPIQTAPPDAILGLTEAFKKDPNSRKVNLGVGVFVDESGVTPILKSVKAAEQQILEAARTKSYMPIAGMPEYATRVQEMILGSDHEAVKSHRVRTAHTPGGTAALRVGADFLKKFNGQATVWLSSPTWANHKGIFTAAHFKIAEYPYYNPATQGLDFEKMRETLNRLPVGDVVVLHVCCHNPAGVDLSASQWKEVAAVMTARRLIPFLDFAYQGYGAGLEEDRAGVLMLAGACPEMLVASSFSKNFGLYQDRVGALTLLAADNAQSDAAFSHVETTIRVNYSNPPGHGGLIVTRVLGDTTLRTQWLDELKTMRERISSVRSQFADRLSRLGVARDFSFIKRQSGMFSFSGLSDAQVKFLREKKSIYIVTGGRINVAGITPANIEYLCESIREALTVG